MSDNENEDNNLDNNNPSKQQLENRLYDQGFSHYTMPSVFRENNKSLQKKPLVARLYSLNNNLIKEVKQPQTSILYNRKPKEINKNPKLIQIYKNQMDYGFTTKINISVNNDLKNEKKNNNKKFILNKKKNSKKIKLKQINEKELKQTKMVLNKLRFSYLEKTKYYRNVERPLKQPMETIKKQLIKKSSENLIKNPIQKRTSQNELDTYINLLLRNSPNIDEFIYLVQNPKSEDPYDLILRNYFQISQTNNKIKKNKLPSIKKNGINEVKKSNYYTISIKGLCRFKEGRPVEFIGLNEWLKERETYDKIRNLGFFADFLKWKTVKLWRKSYKSFKKKVAMKNLEEKLFINYPELKNAIIKTKNVLYQISQLVFLDLNFQQNNNNEVIEISEFIQLQENKANQTQNKIERLSKECHQIYLTSLDNRLEILRNEVALNNENDNVIKKNNNQVHRNRENPYENLGFPWDMSYDKRSLLRKECLRFIKFAYFIDFLAVDSLTKIYTNSLKFFIEEISDLTQEKKVVILRDLDKTKPMGFRDAFFKMKVEYNLDYEKMENLFNFEEKEVSEFKFPKIDEDDLKPSDYKSYNLLTFPFKIDYNIIEDFNEQQKKYLEYGDNRKFKKVIVNNIEKSSLKIVPNLPIFLDNLDKTLNEGINCLQAFISHAKHPSMKKYYAVLEEWEDHEDNQETNLEKNFLNPDDWIDKEIKFKLEKKIKTLFKIEFKKAEDYLGEFKEYLQINWEYYKLNFDVLLSKNLAKPGITYNAILNLLDYQTNIFESKIPFLADLGLFRVDSKDMKNELKDKPKNIKDIIIIKILEEIKNRFVECRDWLKGSKEKLEMKTQKIENFVSKTNYLNEIEKRLGYYKDGIKTSKEIIDTLKRFQIEITKDIQDLYNECKNYEQSLISQIIIVNDNLNEKNKFFSKEIKEISIPELEEKCKKLEETLSHSKYLDINEKFVLEELKSYKYLVKEYKETSQKLNQFQEVLKIKKTKFGKIQNLSDDLNTKILLWESYQEWFKIVYTWEQTYFKDIDLENIQKITEKYQKNVSRCRKKIPLSNAILIKLDSNIKNFNSLLPIIQALRNEKLLEKKKHLDEIAKLIGRPLDLENMTLKNFLIPQVLEQQQKIIGISVQVSEEAKLKTIIENIKEEFGVLKFPLKPFKEDSPKDSTYILGDCTDLVNKVDKLIMKINGVYGSRFLNEYKKETTDKRKEILTLQELLIEWIKFQKNYIYLESIFSQPEIKKPLSIEVNEFETQINKIYKGNIKKISLIQNIAQLSKQKSIELYVTCFKKHNETLNKLNKKINDFLDKKREAFPRFYFVANDELIDILANYDNPVAVQGFVGKLFENVAEVIFHNHEEDLKEFKVSTNQIFGIKSREGEKMFLKTSINIKTEGVDKWMKKLEECISDTLFKVIKDGLKNYSELTKDKWYLENTAQVTAVITQIAWTINAEEFLKNLEKNEEEQEDIDISDTIEETQKNLEILISLVRQNISYPQHKAVVALITNEVHNRDILELLAKNNIESSESFLWQQQLRYYYKESPERLEALYIKQINSRQNYGYEYYGPCSRIVITPLTDKCWITITSALHMKLGAAPQGPAGTGKTESTKDLAKSLGRFCLVFNCSEQINCKMMEKLFRGIIQQGAWTCLDEFNRIDIEVLSVVAQQLLDIKIGLSKEDNDNFYFAGSKCALDYNCGVFITMNPGYAGRTELPDNLKALFRPISMMIPNYTLIAKILLFSQGFLESKNLAAKMIKLYKLSSEQLSQQKHYDFGMRAVKSVLEMAGQLKRNEPEENENNLLIRALKDSNIPKFLKEDLPLFNALISDLFPNLDLPTSSNDLLINKSRIYLENLNYNVSDPLLDKILQLSEILNVRFGTMVVGSAMTGKTTIINSLKASKNMIFKEKLLNEEEDMRKNLDLLRELQKKGFYSISSTTINPKSVTMGELYGEENLQKDWTDGLASYYIRKATTSNIIDQKWICFDGPVDALWIENMNSVLDDSRMLCLSNGQRIRLKEDIRILFEVDNLEQASPATVSRCGMVYIAEEVLGWESFIESWILASASKEKDPICKDVLDHLKEIFEFYFSGLLDYYRTLEKIVDVVNYQCVKGVCNILSTVLDREYGYDFEGDKDYKINYATISFVYACAWGLGATLPEKEGEKFDNMIKKKFSNIEFSADSITNSYMDPKHVSLELYSKNMKKFEFDINTPFWDILVPTVDTIKLSYIIKKHLDKDRNVFLTGPSGTGKSVLVSNLLKINDNNIDTLKFNFSAQTKSKTVQETILGGLFLLSQKSRGARSNYKNVIFVDDVNMPAKERYGAQPPIELLRQLFDFGFFYDRKEKTKITIKDTCFVCLASPPEGGRNALSTRFTRHFDILCFPNARNSTISRIFNSILEGYLTNFEDNIKNICHDIVNASIEFYERICKEKLPTPSKFHYTFNLRDLSKVFMGLSKMKTDSINDVNDVCKIWGHEIKRVFYDRLNSDDDRNWFYKNVEAIASDFLKKRPDDLMLKNSLFSGIFTISDEEVFYKEIKDEEKLIKCLNDFQMDFNDVNKNKLNLVFFRQAIEHTLRLLRIIRQERGNALLVGVGGLGKSSITRISSFITKYNFKELETSQNFSTKLFKEWLRKKILLECAGDIAGENGKPLCLLVRDNQIIDDSILEDINNLLNSGEVPNIFPKDEKEKLEKNLIDLYEEKKIKVEVNDIWKVFVERVRKNLHIVLCMSPIGESLKIWCRKFPAVVNCCTIDWYENWSGEALESVAYRLLENKSFHNLDKICEFIEIFHRKSIFFADKFKEEMNRKFFITPKTALDNINLFIKLLNNKKVELDTKVNNFILGSEKLEDMEKIVSKLKIDLKKAQPLLEEQSKLASEKLIELEKSSKIANDKKEIVEKKTKVIQVKKNQIIVINNQAKSQLEDALPKIQAAENDVRNIDRKQMNDLRSLNNLPKTIEFIFKTVCIALSEKYISWQKSGKKLLSDLNKFIEKLIKKIDMIKEKGSEAVSPSIMKKLKKNLENELFSDKELEKNIIARPLGMWCKAIYEFTNLKKLVEPLEKNAKEMGIKLTEAETEYSKIAKDLEICKNEFETLQDEFNEMDLKKKKLEENIEFSKIKLERAGRLTSLLSDEKERWKNAVENLKNEKLTLVGDVFMSSAFVSYLGPLTSNYRKSLINSWKNELAKNNNSLIIRDNFNFLDIMGDPLVIKEWCFNGLPSDEVSIISGLSATLAEKWPLLIDPQLQANKWLNNILGTNEDFIIIKSNMKEKQFIETMKIALNNGYSVLYEDCKEVLNTSLDSVINRSYYKNILDNTLLINFNEKPILYNENFKLFMTTKLSNPNFLPDVFIKTNVINFTVTQKGLEDQLLAEVMKLERPEDEKIKNDNIEKIGEYKKKMMEIEKKILDLLVKSEKSPVEDENLVQTLQFSKMTSSEIKTKMDTIEKISIEITKTREVYRNVATIGSILFFVTSDISLIDPMYQYSLQSIIKLFKLAIKGTIEKGDKRIKMLKENITKNIFKNVSRGVFEAHKMILSFLIAVNFEVKTGKLNSEKWELFLKGAGVIDREKQKEIPDLEIFNEFSWDLINSLQNKFKNFYNIVDDFTHNIDFWRKFAVSEDIFSEKLPEHLEENFVLFDRLLLVKIFKSEQLMKSIENYIQKKLGNFYLQSLDNKPDDIYTDSDCQTPIIFVLSKGADPSSSIKKIAKEKGKKHQETFFTISLGQGQGIKAERLIDIGIKEGHWILLENCHLAKTWMTSLEKKVEIIQNKNFSSKINTNFRLFLTSMPASYFPVSVLKNSTKITTEPPRGIKANMLRTVNNIDEEFFANTVKPDFLRKLTMGLAFFHSIVQERRKFGPLGWNISYEFNNSDLEAAKDILEMFLRDIETKEEIPWESVIFLTGDITYGGRVTDDLDRRLLLTTLKKFYAKNILNDRFRFCAFEEYSIPKECNRNIYLEFVQNLPNNDNPQIFGLHENANISYQRQEAEKIMKTIVMVMPKENGKSGKNSDSIKIQEMITQFLDQKIGLPNHLDFESGHKSLFVIQPNGLIPSLSIVLLQETSRFNKLIERIKTSLKNLELAIQGKISMSLELDNLFTSLLNNQVPELWADVAYLSLKPLSSWFKNLKERIFFIENWILKGEISHFWLSGFFFPQGFLTGVLQTHARKLNEPIDKFSFSFKATDYNKNSNNIIKPEDGVLISGLFLEGAHWDLKRKSIVDSIKGQTFYEMPLIHFIPKENEDFKGNLYSCPLYKTLERVGTLSTTGQSTNFILEVLLPCEKTPDIWVMKGVALFCELSD